MKKIILIALAATSIFIFSCRNKTGDSQLEKLSKQMQEAPAPETKYFSDKAENASDKEDFKADSTGSPQPPGQQDDRKKQQQPATTQIVKPDWDKKIIKTASINLEVKDYNSFYTSLREKVKNMGGYIAQEEQAQSDYKIENSMVIKVPVDQFDNAVVQLTDKVQKINERKITSQDVTTEIVDTKSRMEAKKHVRERYMDLLNQAKNMNDILSVQSEINGIQEEIESAAGRIEYLGHSSAFSTINLTYYQILNSSAKEDKQEEKPSFANKLKESFRTGWDVISNLFLAVVTIWPLLLASFFAFILYKKLKERKTKQPS